MSIMFLNTDGTTAKEQKSHIGTHYFQYLVNVTKLTPI